MRCDRARSSIFYLKMQTKKRARFDEGDVQIEDINYHPNVMVKGLLKRDQLLLALLDPESTIVLCKSCTSGSRFMDLGLNREEAVTKIWNHFRNVQHSVDGSIRIEIFRTFLNGFYKSWPQCPFGLALPISGLSESVLGIQSDGLHSFCDICYRIECEHVGNRQVFQATKYKKRSNEPVVPLLDENQFKVYQQNVKLKVKEHQVQPILPSPIVDHIFEEFEMNDIKVYKLNGERVLILYHVFSDVHSCGLCCKFFRFGNHPLAKVSASFTDHYRYCMNKQDPKSILGFNSAAIRNCFNKFYGTSTPYSWGAAVTEKIVSDLGKDLLTECERTFCSRCLRENSRIVCHSPAIPLKLKSIKGNKGVGGLSIPVLEEDAYSNWIRDSLEYHSQKKSVQQTQFANPNPNAISTNSNPAPLNVFQMNPEGKIMSETGQLILDKFGKPFVFKNLKSIDFSVDEHSEKKSNSNEVFKALFGSGQYPNQQFQEEAANLTKFSLDDSRIRLFRRASFKFLQKGCESIAGDYMLARAVEVAGTEYLPSDGTKFRGFNSSFVASKTTNQKYALLLARFLVFVLNNHIQEGINEIIEPIEGNLEDDPNLEGFSQFVANYWYSVATNPSCFILSYLRFFAFRYKNQVEDRGGPNNDEEEEDDNEDDFDSTNSNDDIIPTSFSTLVSFCSAILRACKLALGLKAQQEQKLMIERLQSGESTPVVDYLQQIGSKSCAIAELSSFISICKRNNSSIPPTKNIVSLKSNQFNEHELECDGYIINEQVLLITSQRLLEDCKLAMKQCFPRMSGDYFQIIWENLFNPRTEVLEIVECGKNSPDFKSTNSFRQLRDRCHEPDYIDIEKVSQFRDYILVILHWFSPVVLRMGDLQNVGIENLFFTFNYYRTGTMVLFLESSKTSNLILAVLPFFVSRLVLLYLKFISPVIFMKLKQETQQLLEESEIDSDNFETIQRLTLKDIESVSMFLSSNVRIKPSRVKKFKSNNFSDPNSCDLTLLEQVPRYEIDKLVTDLICKSGMHFPTLKTSQLRHVLITVKANVNSFLLQLREVMGGEMQNEVDKLLSNDENNSKTQQELVEGSFIAGHVTGQTILRIYGPQTSLQDQTVPETLFRKSALLDAKLSFLFNLPSAGPPNLSSLHQINNREPIYSTLATSLQPTEVLKNQLGVLGFEDYASEEQKQAAVEILCSNKNIALYLSCGTGNIVSVKNQH